MKTKDLRKHIFIATSIDGVQRAFINQDEAEAFAISIQDDEFYYKEKDYSDVEKFYIYDDEDKQEEVDYFNGEFK